MPTEAAERRAAKLQQMAGATLPPVDHDPLPCPRCDSTNTKFCYYNNYNFSQPRHFCKSCRRYWTHGGTLRDIPVGGGSRKTAKRSRTSSSSPSSTMTTTSGISLNGCGTLMDPTPPTPVFVSLPSTGPASSYAGCGGTSTSSSFTSLLSSAGPGILALGGFGLGLGLDDVGFGLGRGVWAFPDAGYVGGAGIAHPPPLLHPLASAVADGGDHNGGVSSRDDTWQVDSGESTGFGVGLAAGDCFSSLPELAISTPGNGLK